MARALGVVPLLALLVGCGTVVAGNAVPVPNPTFPEPPAPTAERLLRDLESVDPCGQVEPADVAAFGEASVGPVESFDYCLIKLTAGGVVLDVTAGGLDRVAHEAVLDGPVVPYRQGLRIAEITGGSVQCQRGLVFADLVVLNVSVNNNSSDDVDAARLCEVADVVVRAVADRVLAGEVEHRQFAAKSLGPVHACRGLSDATVARLPGLAGAKAWPYPAGHQCRWSADGTTTPPRVRVLHSVGTPTEPNGGNSKAEDIAGRPTVVSGLDTSSYVLCGAETTHIPFDGGLRELALVTVALPTGATVEDACAAVRIVAAEVWAGLPR
ncbi:DUF3558 domain-containing protein [Saccharothrix carnea]|nr:DUF3558 domain-containing protein [Saccharothrix carnea]